MRAAIYCRISRDDGGGLGVQRQEEDCRSIAHRRGWEVGEVFVDNDFSAFSGRRRPAYQSLIGAVDAGRVAAVVAWAPERLHRSPRELEDFLELIERTGTSVETVKAGSWDVSTSHGRLVARMLGAVSRAESERTGERVSRAHQQAKSQGFWRGPIPYGMRAGASAGRPEPAPDEASVVQDVYSRVLRGDALTRIAADLNGAGCKPRRGLAWTHTGISRLIASPALGGLVEVDGELRPAAFEGVVEPETWHAARAAIKRRPRGESRRPREKLTLLGGILTCDEHGHVCFGGSAAHASTYVAAGPGRCNVSITRAAADTFVTRVVMERLRRPDAASLFATTAPQPALDAEAADLRRRRDELMDLVADGLLPGPSARSRLTEIARRLQEIDSQQAPAAVSKQMLEAPDDTWTTWSPPQRRELLRLLFSSITVAHVGNRGGPVADPTRINLQWA